MAHAAQQEAQAARIAVRRAALRLWQAVNTQSPERIDDARRELEAGRAVLTRTGQELVVDDTDGVIDDVQDWFDGGSQPAQRAGLDQAIQDLYVRAGGDPATLAPAIPQQGP